MTMTIDHAASPRSRCWSLATSSCRMPPAWWRMPCGNSKSQGALTGNWWITHRNHKLQTPQPPNHSQRKGPRQKTSFLEKKDQIRICYHYLYVISVILCLVFQMFSVECSQERCGVPCFFLTTT